MSTRNIWRTAFGVTAAVSTYLLTQTEVVLPPIAAVLISALLVALAVINPPSGD